MSTTRKTWKLQEFVAHGSNVCSLALGQKSGRVMVTGGEDNKVNVWAVGKPNVILSLSGMPTAVEAVKFNHSEELVLAGAQSGSLKLWDLEAAKVVRALSGHKSNIRCLDFHPYGDFVASGAMDTNIKLWDVRRKGCLYTYKGHSGCVNAVSFSPDGRWILSGSEDSTAKLWDIAAGKVLTEFKEHTASVNSLQFHPNEFLLATGSSDRTVKFWDLDNFHLLGTVPEEPNSVRKVFFHPEGTCLFTGSQDMCRIYGWEPVTCYESLPTGWGRLFDFGVASQQLIGATVHQTNVSIHVVELNKVNTKLSSDAGVAQVGDIVSPPPSLRKNFVTDRPKTQSSKPVPDASVDECADEGEDEASYADIKQPHDYKTIFQPNAEITRTPPNEPFLPPDDEVPGPPVLVAAPVTRPEPSSVPSSEPQRPPTGDRRPHSGGGRESTSAQPSQPIPQNTFIVQTPLNDKLSVNPSQQVIKRGPAPPVNNGHSRVTAAAPVSASGDDNKPSQSVSVGQGNVNLNEFLPSKPADVKSERDILSEIGVGHSTVVTVLDSRLKRLQVVQAMWSSGEVRKAVETAIHMKDEAVLVDLLNCMADKMSLWNLDLVYVLSPHCVELLRSKWDSYVHTACNCLRVIIKNFSPVIMTNIEHPSPSIGVDISREERYKKCKACYDQIISARRLIEDKKSCVGKLGNTFRELNLLITTLELKPR